MGVWRCIDQQLGMVGGRGVVVDGESIAFSGLGQPHHPSSSITDKLEKSRLWHPCVGCQAWPGTKGRFARRMA